MMPGIGFAEMVLLVLVAIVVIGPKDLPLMMRKFGRFTGKMRALAFEFQQGIDELGRQAELEELRKEVQDLKKHTGIDDLQKEMEQDRIALERDVAKTMAPVPVKQATSGPAAAAGLGVAADGTPAPGAPAADHGLGDDFRLEGHGPEPAAPAAAASPQHDPIYGPAGETIGFDDDHAPGEPVAPRKPQVKQDTPA
jgi:sec-independent protein translocase protein TatB